MGAYRPRADGRRGKLEGRLERVDVHEHPFPRLVGSGRLAVRIVVRVVDPTVFARRRPRREACHRPQCRRIFSITVALRRLDEGDRPSSGRRTRGQANGSISYTRLMSMAQVWVQRRDAEGSRTLPRDGRGPQGIKPTPRRFPSSCAQV